MIQLHSINDSATYHPWLSNIPSMIQLHSIHDSSCNVHPIHDCATFHPWLCYIPHMTLLHPIHDSAASNSRLCYIPSMTLLHPILDSATSPSILCYIMSMLHSSHDSATSYPWFRYTLLTPLHLLESAAVHLRCTPYPKQQHSILKSSESHHHSVDMPYF